jgi:hypothetical protein
MSSKNINLNTRELLERVGKLINNSLNEAIAKALNVDPQVCSNWKARNSIPWSELLTFL